MATATLTQLVKMVRAEAGHALTPAQGLNTVDSLKHLIQRKEYELWTAFTWPTLVIRAQFAAQVGQYKYDYDPTLPFDQIREVWWSDGGNNHFTPLDYGLTEDCIKSDGTNSISGRPLIWEDGQEDAKFRVWPTPNLAGYFRFKGLKALNTLVNDDDYCTLDPTLIAMFSAAELLQRAKAEDAAGKEKNAQRHLQKLLGNKVSAKHKVSTFGAIRGPHASLLRPSRIVV